MSGRRAGDTDRSGIGLAKPKKLRRIAAGVSFALVHPIHGGWTVRGNCTVRVLYAASSCA